MKSWVLERRYSKQMIDSQMRKVKFGQRLKAGSKQAGVGVPYHTKVKKIAQIMKKLEHHYIRMNLLREYFLLH